MIVTTRFIFRGYAGFTIWPFVFVHPNARHDHGLIEHELVHLAEQRRWLVLPWLAAYLCSRRFRCGAEVRAYKRQLALGSLDLHEAAASLMKYRHGITYAEAVRLLS